MVAWRKRRLPLKNPETLSTVVRTEAKTGSLIHHIEHLSAPQTGEEDAVASSRSAVAASIRASRGKYSRQPRKLEY